MTTTTTTATTTTTTTTTTEPRETRIVVTETTGDITTTVDVWPLGQQDPSDGDDVQVRARIMLPRDGDGRVSLHPDVQFGTRVAVLNMYLRCDWGHFGAYGDCRYLETETHAATWADARSEALAKALAETAKLHAALRARADALAAAGDR